MSRVTNRRSASGVQSVGPARACLGCVFVLLVVAGLAMAVGWNSLSEGPDPSARDGAVGDARSGGTGFDVVRAWFERLVGVDPPWPQAERWFRVQLSTAAQDSAETLAAEIPASVLPIWRAQGLSVDAWLVRRDFDVRLYADAATPVRAAVVAPGWLETLGLAPRLGRGFVEDDVRLDKVGPVLLTSTLWQDLHAGSADSIGKTVRVDGSSYVVVGVLPAGIEDAIPVQLWIAGSPEELSLDGGSLAVLARLRDGAGPEVAEAELSEIARRAGYGGVRLEPVTGR